MRLLYPELTPKNCFYKILETHILPQLSGYAFKLLKTGPTLKAKVGGFEWMVEFQGQFFNSRGGLCIFKPMYTVRSVDYRKCLKKLPKLNHGKNLGTMAQGMEKKHWDPKLFVGSKTEARFLDSDACNFTKHDNMTLTNRIADNIKTLGIPFFKYISTFEGIKPLIRVKISIPKPLC